MMNLQEAISNVDDHMGAVKRQLKQNETRLSGEDQEQFNKLEEDVQNLVDVAKAENTEAS